MSAVGTRVSCISNVFVATIFTVFIGVEDVKVGNLQSEANIESIKYFINLASTALNWLEFLYCA